jgi:PAS domain-containing protein
MRSDGSSGDRPGSVGDPRFEARPAVFVAQRALDLDRSATDRTSADRDYAACSGLSIACERAASITGDERATGSFDRNLVQAAIRDTEGHAAQRRRAHADAVSDTSDGLSTRVQSQDLTMRKAAEAHLAQMEGRYRALLEAAPHAMVVVNGAGEIVLLNARAETRFGYCRDVTEIRRPARRPHWGSGACAFDCGDRSVGLHPSPPP